VNSLLIPTKLSERLYVGPKPPTGSFLLEHGFDALVLCAEEIQLRSPMYAGLFVIHAPLDDSGPPIREDEKLIALNAADRTVNLLRSCKKVAVTCAMGINRSGLVSALALRQILSTTGKQARMVVQTLRVGSLQNRSFVAWLDSMPQADGSPYRGVP
jgi:hypothetical protein